MRAAWQCETTWSPRVCRGVSKPLALAPGQTAPEKVESSATPFYYQVSMQRLIRCWCLQETGTSCFCPVTATADIYCCVLSETRSPSWSKQAGDITLTYSNPCDWHMHWLFSKAARVDTDKSNGSLTCNMILSLEEGLRMGGCVHPQSSQLDAAILQLNVFVWWVKKINPLSSRGCKQPQKNDSPGSIFLASYK